MESSVIQRFCGWNDIYGRPMETLEYVQMLRDEDRQEKKKNFIADQAGPQENMLAAQADILIFGGARGGPLLVDTKVVTPFGYRRIDDLKAGDIISGLDGSFQKVLYKVNHGLLPSYKLKFIDGSEVIASYDHPWNVRKTCKISKKRRNNNLSLSESWEVYTTQMIVDFLNKKEKGEIKNGHIVVPVCKPVKFTANQRTPIKIDPYVFGALLGDGCFSEHLMSHGKVGFTTEDEEIVNEFTVAGYDMSNSSNKTNNNAKDYRIYSKDLCEALEYYGMRGHLSHDKFIPERYKFAPVDVRISLLQGLMDTDGSIDQRGHLSYSTVSKQLAEDVKFLVSSLGGIATISFNPTHYIKNGERVECNGTYDIYIKIEDSFRFFRLSRKKDRSRRFNGGVGEYTRRIVGYEYVGLKECCCIRVSNADSLFMVEDFVVTHNSKSFSILLEALKDIINPAFNAVILRHEKPDLENLIEDSKRLYKDYGYYVSSDKDMCWKFNAGGKLTFNYHAGLYDDFKIRFQGKQYSYIAVDEVTHIDWDKFLYLLTTLRNAHGIRNRFVGSCNPDKRSWVRKFIDHYIGNKDTIYEDGKKHPELAGYPIKERCGKLRYCFLAGSNNISDIVWGDSREEVYDKVKDQIAELWDDSMSRFGDPKDLFIMSVTFLEAKITDNLKLLESDPAYIARLANQSHEQVMADLRGNWDADSESDEYLSEDDMIRFFHNTRQFGDNTPRASLDVAFEGGDAAWMWLRIGNHYQDFVSFHMDAANLMDAVRQQLAVWHVKEENFVYDVNGIGQAFRGFFKHSMPFNNMEAPWGQTEDQKKQAKLEFDTLKSQTFFSFADEIKIGNISIEPSLLSRRITAKGLDNVTVEEMLMSQRRIFAIDINKLDTFRGKCIIGKKEMKRILGYSPDASESMAYCHAFNVKKIITHRVFPRGYTRYVRR